MESSAVFCLSRIRKIICYSGTPFTDWDSFQRNFVLSISKSSSLKTTFNEEHIWLSELAQNILQSLQFSSSWRGYSFLWNLCEKRGFSVAYMRKIHGHDWHYPCPFNNISAKYYFSKNTHRRYILPGTFRPTSEFLQWFLSRLSCFNFVSLYLCILVAKLSLLLEGQNTINPPQFHNNFNVYFKQHPKQSSVA